MIITKIIGGLGNQIFQYAIARRIAHDVGQDFYLDTADFSWYRRPYFLDRFNIQGKTLPESDAKKWRAHEGKHSWRRWLEERKPMVRRNYRLEPESIYYTFDENVLRLPPKGDLYLNGYWQHEKYFMPIREILLRDFTLKPEHAAADNPIMRSVREAESVGIHFRRGDDQVNKMYGTPTLEYYAEGVEEIAKRNPGKTLKLFVFSNDIAWVKENFKSEYETKILEPQDNLTDYQEFSALASCKHQVIANSTFSWWAAWLNDHAGRVIVGPKEWLINERRYDTSELLPPSWIRL